MSGLHLIDKLTSWTRIICTLYFTLKLVKWSLTARVVTKVTTSNSLKGGTKQQDFFKRGHVPLVPFPVPPPMKQPCFSYLRIMFSLLFLSLLGIWLPVPVFSEMLHGTWVPVSRPPFVFSNAWRLCLKFHCHANMLTTFLPFPSFSPLLPMFP